MGLVKTLAETESGTSGEFHDKRSELKGSIRAYWYRSGVRVDIRVRSYAEVAEPTGECLTPTAEGGLWSNYRLDIDDAEKGRTVYVVDTRTGVKWSMEARWHRGKMQFNCEAPRRIAINWERERRRRRA